MSPKSCQDHAGWGLHITFVVPDRCARNVMYGFKHEPRPEFCHRLAIRCLHAQRQVWPTKPEAVSHEHANLLPQRGSHQM